MLRKSVYLILILSLFVSLALAETVIPAGSVSGTWTAAGSPYLIQGEIDLPSNLTLDIDPGVKVIFQGHYKFNVYGMLEAIGAASEKIVFTASNPDSGWHGLRFYNLSQQPDSSRLVHCNFTRGITSADPADIEDRHGGAIYCSNSSCLVIRYCMFADNRTADVVGADALPETSNPGESVTSGNGGAIYLLNSSPEISYSTFENNRTGDATGGTGGFPPWQYTSGRDGGAGGDATSGDGGAIYNDGGLPRIMGNEFRGNKTGDAFGGEGGHGGEAYDPYVGDVWAGDGGAGGQSMVGCGGAVFSDSPLPVFSDNILRNNCTGDGLGGTGGEGGYADTHSAPGYAGDGGEGGDVVIGKGGAFYTEFAPLLTCYSMFINNSTGNGQGGNGGTGGSCNPYCSGHAGDGGDGGDASGGEGGCIAHSLAFPASFLTISRNQCGLNRGGLEGVTGVGTYPGPSGTPGIGISGEYIIYHSPGFVSNITNTIIWDNGGTTAVTVAQFSYCCIEGGWPGTGNIDSDPLFLYPAENDFRLQWGSPCIDAGNPDPQYNDPDGTVADMGCYYYDQSVPVNVLLTPHDAPLSIPPSGGSFEFTVWLNNISTSMQTTDIWCDVRDLSGTVLATVIGPIERDIAASAQLHQVRTQSIPGGLAMGTYTFNAFAVAASDTSCDSFSFFKENGDDAGHQCDWPGLDELFDGSVVSATSGLPEETRLSVCYPNPFNPTTVIGYQLQDAGFVTLSVYDVQGRAVAELVRGWRDAGRHDVTFDASNLASGIYFYRLDAGEFSEVGKMVLMK